MSKLTFSDILEEFPPVACMSVEDQLLFFRIARYYYVKGELAGSSESLKRVKGDVRPDSQAE